LAKGIVGAAASRYDTALAICLLRSLRGGVATTTAAAAAAAVAAAMLVQTALLRYRREGGSRGSPV